MQTKDKIYTLLCALFALIVTIGNMIYQKFVALPLLPFHTFEISTGVLFYPLAFLVTDLIAEFYGKERAGFCVKLGIVMNVVAAGILLFVDSLDALEWSKIDSETFHKVFGTYHIAFLGSMLACYISQIIDITIYLWIKKRTNDRYLWMRNIASAGFSLLIDTSVALSFMAFFGALEVESLLTLIINSYAFKIFMTICMTPIFYFAVWTIKWCIRLDLNQRPLPSEGNALSS